MAQHENSYSPPIQTALQISALRIKGYNGNHIPEFTSSVTNGTKVRAHSGSQPKTSVYTYNASCKNRGINMDKHLTVRVIPRRIRESIVDVYDFINKSTAMCLYDGLVVDIGNTMIWNCGLHDRNSNEVLYSVASKQSKRRVFKMHDTMYTKYQLCECYGLQEHECPRSYFDDVSNNMRHMMKQINSMFDLDYPSILLNINRLPVVRAMNKKYNKRRLTFSITKTEFMATLKPKSTLIPIIMFNCNGFRREYLQIVTISDGIDIGVSYVCDQNVFKATGIHLNKENILRQHQLADPHHNCHCLDGFESMIDDLHIGNPDDDKNRVKDLRNRNDILKRKMMKEDRDGDDETNRFIDFLMNGIERCDAVELCKVLSRFSDPCVDKVLAGMQEVFAQTRRISQIRQMSPSYSSSSRVAMSPLNHQQATRNNNRCNGFPDI
eukprot:49819_1